MFPAEKAHAVAKRLDAFAAKGASRRTLRRAESHFFRRH
ncbi:hypothetical protein OROHE_024631 [Orobanche hederae]